MANLPYAQRTGTLETMLEKIKAASVPDKFSQDFVSTKLAMKGGTPRSIIPFIKKMGLVAADGSPTERYRQFRNPAKSGAAIAQSLRELYSTLFEMNEYAHDLNNVDLRNLIVEATGAEPNSRTVEMTLSTFNALRKLADFESNETVETNQEQDEEAPQREPNPLPVKTNEFDRQFRQGEGINLSYTINLNLPASTDIEVFNAIFKSLRQHLLQE